ncbi:hypothetical protein LXL04_003669 [Taraxacum kok-saghyz]
MTKEGSRVIMEGLELTLFDERYPRRIWELEYQRFNNETKFMKGVFLLNKLEFLFQIKPIFLHKNRYNLFIRTYVV